MKPTHLLIPVDFSEASGRALEYGLFLADAFAAEVTLVHVVVLPAEESAGAEAEEKLASLLPGSFSGKVRLLAPVVASSVGEELLGSVRETSADLVVLGTRGLGPLKRFLLGSTTEHLLRVLPVPVMTVSRPDGEEHPPSRVTRILCPTDFSEPAGAALPAALDFARHFGARVEVVHVVEHPAGPMVAPPYGDRVIAGEPQEWIGQAEESLRQIVSALEAGEIAIDSTVLLGRPWQALLNRAAETEADLIVMGLHGRSFLERTLLGATAERVIRQAPVPVLGIPAV